MKEYIPADMSIWQGRVDSEDDYRSFRWHQWVKPIDLNNEILINKNKLSFILIGYKIDEGIKLNKGRVGSAYAPDIIREFLASKPCSFKEEVTIYDAGNVVLDTSVENAQQTLKKLLLKCLRANYFPIVIGGGHDVSYGTMSALVEYLDIKKREFAIINFDAHFDLRNLNQATSGTSFYLIYNDIIKKQANFNHLTIGIQKSANTISLFDFAKKIKSDYFLALDLTTENTKINHYRLDHFLKNMDDVYISVCSDVFASNYAPGVSSPQPLGISPEVFIELFKYILETKKVVAFDIAEVSPSLDNSNATASLAALIIYTLVNHLGEINDLSLNPIK